ncbi:pancreatic lipase-related protein 2-like [Diorhabda carinulata]|uniref:pancreatic lipase-related protein 2-like n=1 Tax=Diorhabda carinulata TaxID=1163345 RepID=UPI0025A24057|nr:pancreatic lipase-related protein 2-like [Diorhabda carinulata]
MKLLILITIILAKTRGDEEVYEEIDDYSDDLDAPAMPTHLRSSTDIIYHFYCQLHPSNTFDININNVDLLKYSNFSAKKNTLFIIHGWKNNNESSVNHKIREKILHYHDINVVVVDWSKMAGGSYLSAKNSVTRVGKYVADFILKLKELFGLKLSKVKFVGHSLGAHICGNAGAALGGKVDRILGLDPAGPLFTMKNKDNRLDASDARFVQVIHTSTPLGFGEPVGDADYFPNGGSSQPGCGWDLIGTCAHSRAYALYAESLGSEGFISRRCKSFDEYKKGRCENTQKSVMGGFELDYKANGTYYLRTNGHSPYAMW